MNAPFLPRVLRCYQRARRNIPLRARRSFSDRSPRRRQGRRGAHGARRLDPRRARGGMPWSSRRSSSPRPCGRRRSHPGRTCGIFASPSSTAIRSAGGRSCAAAAEREVTVIGVDLVPWLVGELAGFADDHPIFDMLVIDETSRLKDPSGKRARALLKVAGRFRTRWGLTGTPRPNSSQDLFMPAAIITDGALWGRAFVPWQKRHFRPRDPFGREWVALPGAEEQIAADFGTIAMTVADEDMPDLPPLNIVVTRLKLPDAVMATYKTMQRELFATIEERSIEAVSPLVATGKCAQLANGFLYDEGNEDPVEVHTVKIDWLRELVESLDGEPLLIAYEFIEDLRTIRRAFGEVPALGGLTPAREAARLVADWNAGKLPLLAFHPASAGHGLNLQHGGSRMAWLSPSWSAELTEQAIARIYRPGQTQHVTIHVCVAAGTVDEMKRDRVLGKMSARKPSSDIWSGSDATRTKG